MEREAGEYEAVFIFAAGAPRGDVLDGWGKLQIRQKDGQDTLAEAAIEPVGGGPSNLRTQRLSFSLAAPAQVQAVVVGERAELWLLRVDCVRHGAPWEF